MASEVWIGSFGTLAGILATLFVKDKARQVLQQELHNYLAAFKLELIELFDKRYRGMDMALAEHKDIEERIDAIEERFGMIDEIATAVAIIKDRIANSKQRQS
jgi:hypothetical protein